MKPTKMRCFIAETVTDPRAVVRLFMKYGVHHRRALKAMADMGQGLEAIVSMRVAVPETVRGDFEQLGVDIRPLLP